MANLLAQQQALIAQQQAQIDEMRNALLPTVTTASVSNTTASTAFCGGTVTDQGYSAVIARGVCWSAEPNPTVEGGHTSNGNGTGDFASSIIGLQPSTTYYVRAYATNSVGTAYGEEVSFTTSVACDAITLPYSEDFESYTTSTTAATGVQPNCWELVHEDAAMTEANRPQLYYNSNFAHSGNYSLKLYNRGIYAMPELDEGIAINQVKLEMYLRQANAKYQLQVGVWDGQNFVSVATFNNSTTEVEHVTCDFSSYIGSGRRVAFRNTLGSGSSLNYSTNYLDDIVLNINGGAVVDDKSCPNTPTVTDHEGNVYATVQIGQQCWMRDNLRTTTSPSTGTYLIPAVGTDDTYTGKQARWYNNDSATYAPMNYGLLYNWNAVVDTFNTAYGETSVNTSSSSNAVSVSFTGNRRGICPAGWHLPSDAEWTQLTNYIGSQSEYTCGGSSSNIAKALASTEGLGSYSGECYPGDQSVTANNATGFSAVPAGNCYGSLFYSAGNYAEFGSSTQYGSGDAWYRCLDRSSADVNRSSSGKNEGFSVRCLRD